MVNSVTRRTLQKPKKGEEWLCPGCKMLNQEPATSCHACLARSNPRLTPKERALATVFEPDDLAVQIWHGYRGLPANDKQLLGSLAAICEGDAACHTDLGPYCWAERDGEIEIWAGRETPGDDVEALDKLAVLNAIRSIYQIPHAKEPASGIKAVGAWQCPHCPVTRGWNEAEWTECHSCGRARPDANGKAPATNGKAPKPAEASAEPTPPNGIESNVPTGSIVVGDKNPRIHFDEAKLQEAAASLKTHGQLQNLVVWQPDRLKSKGQYELIAGERRLRAGKIAGLPTMRCRILQDITEEQATELRGIENLIREDLSAIETARWYQQMLDLTKPDGSKVYTQASLAERLKCSQPTIANRLRLLKLPEAWQQRIIRREISESHGLVLVPFCDVADVLKQLEKDLRDQDVPPLSDWKEWIGNACDDCSLPVQKGSYFHFNQGNVHRHGDVLLTKADLEKHGQELDIREVPNWNDGTQPRAFNTARWWELQSEREKKQEERRESGSSKAAKAETRVLTPAEQRKADQERRRRASEILKGRLHKYRIRWLQRATAARLANGDEDDLADVPQIIFWLALKDGHRSRREKALRSVYKELGLKTPTGDSFGPKHQWLNNIAGVSDFKSLARHALAAWVQLEFEGWQPEIHAREVEAIADLVGVNMAEEWKLDREFLELHSVDQLKVLCKEWKLGAWPAAAKARKFIVDTILRIETDPIDGSEARRLPAPKSLLQAKG